MFVITAKVNRKKIMAALLGVVILAAVLILVFSGIRKRGDAETAALTAVVKNAEQRVAYLESFGWQVGAAVEEQSITIPREFNQIYTEYNTLQKRQGFDLTQYGGLEATRYTYEIKNYPGVTGTVVADIIVYRNQVIAGDVQHVAADGFMTGLAFPGTGSV